MEGWEDPFNRAGYPWGQEDTDLKAHFARAGPVPALTSRHCKPASSALASGPPVSLLAFARELDGQLLTTVVNAADVSQSLIAALVCSACPGPAYRSALHPN